MQGRSWVAIGSALIALVLAAPASAQFSPGARTLGEPYPFLQHIGNGGYDALHYDLTIDYDPIAHFMVSSTDITMKATQGLSEFSLDFVPYYTVSSVKIDGVDATWTRDDDADPLAYKHKLVITPAAGIPDGSTFRVVIAYSGTPQNFEDPDGSLEGFMRTTATLGSFTMNEPMGAMGWFPNNNHPSDKATYDFHLTAPSAYDAIGNGELASKVIAGDKTTWTWRMTYPMASYLSTSTFGLFDDTFYTGATAVNPAGQPLNFYDFIETALPATGPGPNKATNNTQRVRQDAIIKYMADSIGAPYPFDSHGVVAGRAPSGGGYALEVQTKSHFGSGAISIGTLAHEIAHQWFGDSVGPATWREIWFNEGWARWWQVWWGNKQNNSALTTAQYFVNNYDGFEAEDWAVPPAQLRDARDLFIDEYVYARPAIMFEAYRQIVGDHAFFAFQKALVTEFAYDVITTAEVIALAKRIAQEKAAFTQPALDKLDVFFEQWLFGTVKPTITGQNFFAKTSAPGDVSGTVPPTLALTLGPAASFGAFTPGVARDYTASTTANVTSTAGEAALTVVDPSGTAPGRLVNGAFTLASPVKARVGSAAFEPVSGSPLLLKSYGAPVSNDSVPIAFQQSIGTNEPLRTGTYAKTLTFTLSTTTP